MSFGYIDKPKKGLFNPARSLFATDSSLYGSLYASEKRPGKAWNPHANAAGFGGLGDEVPPKSIAKDSAEILGHAVLGASGLTAGVIGLVVGSMTGNPIKGLLIGAIGLPLLIKLTR